MNRQKLGKSFLIGAFILCIGVAFCFAAPSQEERILSVNIGSAESQLGVDFMADTPVGPCDFTIDNEGDILIADGLNKKIKKFDNNGNLKLIVSHKIGWVYKYRIR